MGTNYFGLPDYSNANDHLGLPEHSNNTEIPEGFSKYDPNQQPEQDFASSLNEFGLSLEEEQGIMADFIDKVQQGAYGAAADTLTGVRGLLTDDKVWQMEQFLRDQSDAQQETLSQVQKDADRKFSMFGEGEFSGRGLMGAGASGIGSIAPSMLTGGVAGAAGRGLAAAANFGKVGQAVGAAAGAGAAGAPMIGGGSMNQIREELDVMPNVELVQIPEFDPYYQAAVQETPDDPIGAMAKAREAYIVDAEQTAVKQGAMLGAVSMAAAGPVLEKMVRAGYGVREGAKKGAVTEFGQEAVESGGQEAIVNPLAGRDVMENVGVAAIEGGIIGSGVGGGVGATTGLFNREPTDTGEPPPPLNTDKVAEPALIPEQEPDIPQQEKIVLNENNTDQYGNRYSDEQAADIRDYQGEVSPVSDVAEQSEDDWSPDTLYPNNNPPAPQTPLTDREKAQDADHESDIDGMPSGADLENNPDYEQDSEGYWRKKADPVRLINQKKRNLTERRKRPEKEFYNEKVRDWEKRVGEESTKAPNAMFDGDVLERAKSADPKEDWGYTNDVLKQTAKILGVAVSGNKTSLQRRIKKELNDRDIAPDKNKTAKTARRIVEQNYATQAKERLKSGEKLGESAKLSLALAANSGQYEKSEHQQDLDAMKRQDKKKSKQDRESVFQDKTTIPNLDDPLNNPEYFRKQKNIVVHDETMTPDEYLERVTKGFDGTLEQTIQDIDSDIVDKYAEDMKNGDKFPMLSIDQSGGKFNQEGRHRALAAKKAGINQVPVRIKTDADKQDGQQRNVPKDAESKRIRSLKRIHFSEKVQDENGRIGTVDLGNAEQAFNQIIQRLEAVNALRNCF